MSSDMDDFHKNILDAHDVPTMVLEAVRDPDTRDIVDVRVAYRNAVAQIMSGVRGQVPVGQCIRATMNNAIGEQIYQFNKRILETGEVLEQRVPPSQIAADGEFVVRGTRLGDRVITTYWDITEKSKAAEKLEAFAARLDIATSAAGIGVWEHDIDNGVMYWDQRTREIHGLGPDAPAYFPAIELENHIHPDDWVRLAKQQPAIEEGADLGSEHRIVRADGEIRWVRVFSRLVRDKRGKRSVGICWDVTDQVRASELLARKTEEAEEANDAKSRFLASMSHEIRTPMNGVLGMAQALSMRVTDPQQRDMIDVIVRSGESLLGLLNDILDLSKVEAGGMVIDSVAFDLGTLARDVGALFTVPAEAKGVTFQVEVAANAEGDVLGDELRIRQVLNNLVSNAIKFTDEGRVAVMVYRDFASGDAVIDVCDSGVGIAPEALSQVFDTFVQVDDSNARRFGGSGLGLAIVKGLAEAMGGSASAVSTPGVGSTFTVRLPLPPAFGRAPDTALGGVPGVTGGVGAQPATAAAWDDLAPRQDDERCVRVLVVDDNETNRFVFEMILDAAGVDCVLVADGEEAIAAWEAASFDVVLMDIAMPGMDGCEVVRLIRDRERAERRPRTPILAATANVSEHHLEAYRAAGMDGEVAKPVAAAALIGAVRDAIENGRADQAAAAARA